MLSIFWKHSRLKTTKNSNLGMKSGPFFIDEGEGQKVKVRAQLEEPTKTQLENFLKQNMDVLAYNADEMPDMDSAIMVCCLNVKAKY